MVTIAALFGAGGSYVGPRVAERLGVPFLDRAIPASVARRAGVPEDAVERYIDGPKGKMGKLIASLARVPVPDGSSPLERFEEEQAEMRVQIEEFIAEAAVKGGVILGRGGAVVLGSAPGALHVYLFADRETRVKQAMEIDGIDRETAERRLPISDRARKDYVLRAYGVDGEDPYVYSLLLDTGAFDLDTCVDLIVTASQRIRQAVAT